MTTYSTFEDGAYINPPLIVLVDGNTASASEILSSALQDNGRAVLAGSQTFGKAVIQTVEELDDGGVVLVLRDVEGGAPTPGGRVLGGWGRSQMGCPTHPTPHPPPTDTRPHPRHHIRCP